MIEVWTRRSNVFIVSKRPEAIFFTFNHLRNLESTCSMKNIITLIFDKSSRRGADNSRQDWAIQRGLKIFKNDRNNQTKTEFAAPII